LSNGIKGCGNFTKADRGEPNTWEDLMKRARCEDPLELCSYNFFDPDDGRAVNISWNLDSTLAPNGRIPAGYFCDIFIDNTPSRA